MLRRMVDTAADAPAHGDAPRRVPVRGLALVTALACLVAHGLALAGGGASGAGGGPLGVVVGQAVWNAAQVGLLVLLLCLWQAPRGGWTLVLAIGSAACLPIAIYVTSPGAWLLTLILLAACALAWVRRIPDLAVSIVEAPARGTPTLAKVEFLAFACNLFSSMYNYQVGRGWSAVYDRTAALLGFTPAPATIARDLYTLGLSGVSLPPYILTAPDNPLGSLVFLLLWTVLPFLYVLYFAACAMLAKNTKGTRVQLALCAFCIFHFLFLTDIVDYQFGRGVLNAGAEWAHWSERLAWRIAILLPIYQNLASGRWLRGAGVLGVALHYALAVWAVVFFAYMVLVYDVGGFYRFVTGKEAAYVSKYFGHYNHLLGYPGALMLMVLLYGFMTVAMRCKRVQARPVA